MTWRSNMHPKDRQAEHSFRLTFGWALGFGGEPDKTEQVRAKQILAKRQAADVLATLPYNAEGKAQAIAL